LYLNDRLHREDGPALINSEGEKRWYLHGKLHRVDGPAIESPFGGYKAWLYHGRLHRVDGPAIEGLSGHHEWFYLGMKIKCSSTEEFIKILKLKAFW
jgi:hypothetical protein